eukprot:s31_g31.t1
MVKANGGSCCRCPGRCISNPEIILGQKNTRHAAVRAAFCRLSLFGAKWSTVERRCGVMKPDVKLSFLGRSPMQMSKAVEEKTHFRQLMEKCPLQRTAVVVAVMWRELYESCDFAKRHAEIQEFNRQNRWRKRGIAQLPTKFGISFTAKFMNQAGALVHIYTDGTVLLTHGGTEMGQGLHTKICQIVARAFGIPMTDGGRGMEHHGTMVLKMEDVVFRETGTDTVPNASPTAASASSDIYGMATLNACEQIKGRLQPYLEKFGDFKRPSLSKISEL